MKLKKLSSKKSRAQAMVEFAIALPVLLALLYGILETGRFVFMYSTVVNASRQAVRYGSATGPGNLTGSATEKRYQDCDGIRDTAQKAGFIGAFKTVSIFWDTGPATFGSKTPYCVSTSAQTDSFVPADGNNTRIDVTVTKDFVPLLPKLLPFVKTTITATSSRSVITNVSISVTQAAPSLNAATVTITSHNPNPSKIGQPVTVTVTVTGGAATPTGTVDITGADANCSITLSNGAGSCIINFSSGGDKTIAASYNGDVTHLTASTTVSHKVLYDPIITIAQSLDPSTSGQTVTITVTVSGAPAGVPAPLGTVIVSGADASCTITLSGGVGSCNVVFTSATTTTKTITASYSGDNTNYSNGSSTATHDVILNNDTVTRITALSPSPSVINQSVVVSVRVIGLTTPTGTVNIGGADTNCSITLSNGAGSCSVVFTSTGGKSVSAAYLGDGTHNASNGFRGHTVNPYPTTTTITAHTPDPSVAGQTVSVTVTVAGGTGPAGTVTVTGGDAPCTITLAIGTGSCNVVFGTSGTKTLSAVYNGDSLHASSNGTATHTVAVLVASPVPSCATITHGAITLAGSTMKMTITNPYTFPLTTGTGTVTWNDDKGHNVGVDKTLSLQSATIGATTIWTGSSSNVSTMPFTISATIPASSTVTITFTFQQSYDNLDGTEYIYINLLTPGCESNPIHS